MKSFFILIPGMVYAVNEYGRTRTEAIDAFKRKNGLVRLPNGSAVWPA